MRVLFFSLLLFVSNQLMSAATVLVEVVHQEQVEVTLKDAALGDYLIYDPIFNFPDKTTFGLDDGSFTLLELTIDKEVYYLYVKGSFITIDLVSAKIKSDAFFLFKKKKDFFQSNVNGKWLLHLFQIEDFYKHQIVTIDSLIASDNSFGHKLGDVRYWDKKSAKKLMAYLDKNYALDQDFKLKYNSPSYIAFAKILYQIMYQFGNRDIQNSLTIEQQIERIKSDIFPPMQEAILLYHFFRPSVPLVVMESAYNTDAIKQVDARVYYTAKEAFNRKANRKTAKEVPSINWLFGFDVDVVLNAFFAKQEIKKPSVVVFWTTFGSAMEYEYYHLNKLYQQYGTHLNFIYVCVNAFEQEQKAKAIVSREQLNGHHLFPKNADAYWKSEWKDRKISSLPFYVLVDTEQQLVDAIGIPLDHAALLNSRINSLLFK
jgi:hypothetical protein